MDIPVPRWRMRRNIRIRRQVMPELYEEGIEDQRSVPMWFSDSDAARELDELLSACQEPEKN